MRLDNRWLIAAATALLLAAALLAGSAQAEVTLAWDANPPAEKVTGYVVHHGPQSRAYTQSVDVGNVTQTTVDVPAGTFLAVTAYNAAGLSSDYSDEVQAPAVPTPPAVSAAVTDGLGRRVTVTVTVEGAQ